MRLKSSASRPTADGVTSIAHTHGRQAELFGQHLVALGMLNQQDVAEILASQAQIADSGLFGEIAVRMGKISSEQLNVATASYVDFPLLPVDGGLVDPLVIAATDVSATYTVKVRDIRAKVAAMASGAQGVGRQQLIAVVGIGAVEEASILTANMAVVSAQFGRTTVAVDCGLRTPSLHALFRVPNQHGVSMALGQNDGAITSIPTAIRRLSVIPAGPGNNAADSFLQREALADVLAQWHLNADEIIVNLPEMSDSIASLGNMLQGFDSVILVAKRDVTPITDIRRAIDSLDSKAVPLAGSVIG